MHIPDGFIDLPTSAGFALASASGVAVALKGAKAQLDEKSAPLAGLTATFVFAAQMLNFPVAAGTSGHLLGGVLAALLVGPFAATLAITMVLILQGFLFADGGLSALGLNIFNMALLGVWVGYGLFLLVMKFLPKRRVSFLSAAFVSSLISVPVAAVGFLFQYAIGGTATFSLSTVIAAMLGTHFIIGIGEGVITMLTLSAVFATRPDLIFGWKKYQSALVLKGQK